MASIDNALVAGAPASLVARHALGDAALRDDLLRGRWRLTRGQLEFYAGGALPEDRMAIAEAAAQAWTAASPRGQSTLWVGGRPYFAMSRNSGAREFFCQLHVTVSINQSLSEGIAATAARNGSILRALLMRHRTRIDESPQKSLRCSG